MLSGGVRSLIPVQCFSSKLGVSNILAAHWYQSGPVRNEATQQEMSVNVMRLNHPETTPLPWSMEKLSSMKLVPGAKKAGDHCSRS